jgi:hypothetical protein
MRRFFLILALVFTVTMLLQPRSLAGIFIGLPIPLPVPVFYGPAYYPPGFIITDRTDMLIMLGRTGGIGTGPVATGGTTDFCAKENVMTERLSSDRERSRNIE